MLFQIFSLSQTSATPYLTVAFHICDRSGIGRILVDGESARVDDVPLRDGLAKEPLRRGRIPPRRQKEIDRLPSAVHRPIEIRPTSLHPDVGFVHPPGAVARSQMRAGLLFKLRCVGLGTSEDRRVVDLDAAIEQHELQITVADGKHQIPSHRPKDHLGCELAPLEAITQTHSDAPPDRSPLNHTGTPSAAKFATEPLRKASSQRIAAGTTAAPKTERSTHRTGDGTGRKRRPARMGQPVLSGRPLLVIDGDSFAHRSYHALPKTIRSSDGKAAGAILGFANFVLRLYADQQPRAVIVGWDTLEAPTKRHEMFPAYQSGREFDDDLIEQLKVLPELVTAFGFANAKAPGYEADDFLAAAVAFEERAGGSALVASGDRDSFQLASPRTTILYPSRGGELARIGPEEVHQRYGVHPNQVPDFIALRGDPSDKLPGAAGVGPKRAAQLVRRYGTLDGVLKAGLFQTQAETLRLYRLIATMDAKAPLPLLADQEPTWGSASTSTRDWGLNQLADRLGEMA